MTDVVPARPEELATNRGTTTIAPRAVAKIARRAASEVDGVEVAEASGLRGLLSRGGGASADVATRQTALDLRLEVAWPRPVNQVTSAVRHHVRNRVQELTGYEVTDVDIVIDSLHQPTRRSQGRVS